MKRAFVSYRFSKAINAPLRFVYDWCTDYREDDFKIIGVKARRLILEKTKSRAVFINQPKGTNIGTAINIVTFHPPNGWNLNSIRAERDTRGHYRLRKFGPGGTKLDILFKLEWKMAPTSTKTGLVRHLDEIWEKYAAALERDYKRNQRKLRKGN
ncbi:MAG: hypothetical protein ABSF09_01645 [Candidatus Bathyarchaeia archaeon]